MNKTMWNNIRNYIDAVSERETLKRFIANGGHPQVTAEEVMTNNSRISSLETIIRESCKDDLTPVMLAPEELETWEKVWVEEVRKIFEC